MMTEEALPWPEKRVAATMVCRWIEEALETTVTGPTVVYRPTDWGVVARFATATRGDVVCKISYLPDDASAPMLYPLLRRCAVPDVPQLLAHRHLGTHTWLLFAPFVGTRVRDLGTLPPMLTMARTFARIQVAATEHLQPGSDGLPRITLPTVLDHFDSVVDTVAHLGPLHDAGTEITAHSLKAFRPHFERWLEELRDGGWPDSLDHPDLHTNNAVLQDDSSVLIFDWEGTTVSCPFFAVDSLIENAGRLDRGLCREEDIRSMGGAIYTPSQWAVRTAYLETLPWKTFSERERAFDVSLSVSRLLRAFQHLQIFEALGSDVLDTCGGVMEKRSTLARHLTLAIERWRVLCDTAL